MFMIVVILFFISEKEISAFAVFSGNKEEERGGNGETRGKKKKGERKG